MQRITIIIAAVVAAGLLAGCRQESKHPLVLGNGTYTGGGMTPLSPAQLAALRRRARLQAVADATGSNENMKEPHARAVSRPLVQPRVNDKALDRRLRKVDGGQ